MSVVMIVDTVDMESPGDATKQKVRLALSKQTDYPSAGLETILPRMGETPGKTPNKGLNAYYTKSLLAKQQREPA